jgi:hypothetical protein
MDFIYLYYKKPLVIDLSGGREWIEGERRRE